MFYNGTFCIRPVSRLIVPSPDESMTDAPVFQGASGRNRGRSREFSNACRRCRPRKSQRTRSYTSCNRTDHTRPADLQHQAADRFSTQSKRLPNRIRTAGSQMDRNTNVQIVRNQNDCTIEKKVSVRTDSPVGAKRFSLGPTDSYAEQMCFHCAQRTAVPPSQKRLLRGYWQLHCSLHMGQGIEQC